MNTTKIIAIAATLAILNTGAAAIAQDSASVSIETANVDFGNPGAVDALKSRITRAARTVCGLGKSRDLRLEQKARGCYRQSVADATTRIDRQVAMNGRGNPALTINLSQSPAK